MWESEGIWRASEGELGECGSNVRGIWGGNLGESEECQGTRGEEGGKAARLNQATSYHQDNDVSWLKRHHSIHAMMSVGMCRHHITRIMMSVGPSDIIPYTS